MPRTCPGTQARFCDPRVAVALYSVVGMAQHNPVCPRRASPAITGPPAGVTSGARRLSVFPAARPFYLALTSLKRALKFTPHPPHASAPLRPP
jgi:hypothetical protein